MNRMPSAKCYECRKRVASSTSRYAKDPAAKLNYERGTLTGERVYGPDCFAKLIETGAIEMTEKGAVARD